MTAGACPLCAASGETLLWRDERCRVIRVDEPGYPGFCRVIWNRHAAEMTDLDPGDRGHLMAVVFAVEAALREVSSPRKVNLASLGNQVPHVHWHVIPRFEDDPHFPDAVWSAPRRSAPPRSAPGLERLREAVVEHIDGGKLR